QVEEEFASYRLAYFEGLTPQEVQTIVEHDSPPGDDALLGQWDVRQLNGLYTLILTVHKEDGSFEEVSVPVTVDNAPPTARVIFPIPNQSIFTDEEWVIVQAFAEDDMSIDHDAFYIDNAAEPFAVK